MFYLRLVTRSAANFLIFGGLLFLPAGTWDWPRAWVFLGVVFAASVITIFLLRNDRELLNERMKPPIQKDQPASDKIALGVFLVCYFAQIIFVPLDVFRLHLLPRPVPVISALGLPVFVAGWSLAFLSLKANAFAAPVVKLQKERKHAVADRGVYRIVRHPMYLGASLVIIGLPLWLESYAAMLAAVFPIGALCARILGEERFLKQQLSGYEDYTRRVRYRLIPFVW